MPVCMYIAKITAHFEDFDSHVAKINAKLLVRTHIVPLLRISFRMTIKGYSKGNYSQRKDKQRFDNKIEACQSNLSSPDLFPVTGLKNYDRVRCSHFLPLEKNYPLLPLTP